MDVETVRGIEVKSTVWTYMHAHRSADFGVLFWPVIWVQNMTFAWRDA
jgi:hypothetical protein